MSRFTFFALALLSAVAVSYAFGGNSSGGGVHQCPCGTACGCDKCECGTKR